MMFMGLFQYLVWLARQIIWANFLVETNEWLRKTTIKILRHILIPYWDCEEWHEKWGNRKHFRLKRGGEIFFISNRILVWKFSYQVHKILIFNFGFLLILKCMRTMLSRKTYWFDSKRDIFFHMEDTTIWTLYFDSTQTLFVICIMISSWIYRITNKFLINENNSKLCGYEHLPTHTINLK